MFVAILSCYTVSGIIYHGSMFIYDFSPDYQNISAFISDLPRAIKHNIAFYTMFWVVFISFTFMPIVMALILRIVCCKNTYKPNASIQKTSDGVNMYITKLTNLSKYALWIILSHVAILVGAHIIVTIHFILSWLIF